MRNRESILHTTALLLRLFHLHCPPLQLQYPIYGYLRRLPYMMPHTKAAGAAAVRPEPDPEPLAVWTRGDDKLLEMLIVRNFPWCDWDIMASRHVGKTPEQVSRRYERTVDEVTRALNALQVETPREWDVQVDVSTSSAEKTAVVTTASAGEDAAPVTENARVVPAGSSAADGVASVPGTVKRKPGGKRRKRKPGGKSRNKPVKWTKEEHKYAHRLLSNELVPSCRISSQTGHRLCFHLYSSNSIANNLTAHLLYRAN
jgi:hypothetical protein